MRLIASALLAACAPALAQIPVQVGAARYDRQSRAAFFYTKTPDTFAVHGQCEFTYGSPPWKPEYVERLESAQPGTRLRLGKDFFATFDTSCALDVGGARVAPGHYYLALEATAPDAMALVFLDPEPIRKARLNANQTADTAGGVAAPLAWREREPDAADLDIGFDAMPGESAARLVLRFGPYEMSAVLEPVVETTRVQVGAARYDRLSSAAFFYSKTPDTFDVHGQFELTYGSPPWKPEYVERLESAKSGTRLRLGKDFFATFDTSCTVDAGGARLAPGHYHLALEATGPDAMALVFLDPEPIRKARMNASQTGDTARGVAVPLVWRELATEAAHLDIGFHPTPAERAARLVLRFGPYEMSASLALVVEADRQPR